MQNKILKYIKYILIAVILVFLIVKLYKPLINVSIPFIVSIILTYLLNPVVVIFEKKKISKTISIIMTYGIFMIIFLLFINFIMPIVYENLNELINKVPDIIEKYQIIVNEIIIRYKLSELPDSIKQIINQSVQNIVDLLNGFVADILNLVQGVISNLIYILLIPIITFYFLKDGDYLKERVLYLIPNKYRDDVLVTCYQIDLVLKRFIRGELIVAVIVGSLTSLGLFLIGVKFSLILGLIVGITNFIPYLGPLIGLVPTLLVAFVESAFLGFKAAFVIILIQQIESSMISPKIVGQCVGLHPITIIFSILFAEKIFGFIGMFLALPITLIIIVIFNRLMNNLINNKFN